MRRQRQAVQNSALASNQKVVKEICDIVSGSLAMEKRVAMKDFIKGGPPPLRQRLHTLALIHGIQHGLDVPVSAPFGGAHSATLDEFRQRPAAAGMYVVTRAAPSSRVGTASPKLRNLTYWVFMCLWQPCCGKIIFSVAQFS